MTNGRSLLSRARILWPVVTLSALACSGNAGTPGGQPGNPATAGDTSTSGGGGPTPGGGASGYNASGGTSSSAPRDPGRVTVRRLNRVEYDNTVRDLLGTAQTPAQARFINDAQQLGFDNDGDQQTLSPVQFALYQQAAEALAAEVMTTPAERAKVVACDLATGAACAQTSITNFGLLAFRRPLAADEITTYVNLMATAAQAGSPVDEQFQTVLEAMLVSPNFLFRPEFDVDPKSMTPHLLTPYETASRLSYAIFRSMPDQALFDAASAGKLSEVSDLQAQVQRMLASPKSAFATTFPAQWLGTGGVPLETFDKTKFSTFTPALANSMAGEVTSFFGEFLQQNSPVAQLLTANFSYLDKGLADLYGVPAPTGTGLVRSVLSTPQRGGLLTMAGILAVTSYPTRTSLVKRGAWVLGQLLCAPPPAPPADVPPFPEDSIAAGATQKEILAQHRVNPACASCHDSIDNIGFAMESYNAIGAYRTEEGGMPIDALGKFAGAIAQPDGKPGPTFNGARELSAVVAADPRFAACVAKNVLAYSLGRAIQPTDSPYLTDIVKAPASGQLGVRDVVMNVVVSDTFRMRRGDPASATTGGMQ